MTINTFLTLSLTGTLIVGCSSREYYTSPDSRLDLEIGTSKNSNILNVQLFDNDKNLLDELNTEASDVTKWSLNWYNDTTIVLHSHDIGTYVWYVDKDSKFVKGTLTDETQMSSIKAFNEKYQLDVHSPKICLDPVQTFDN